MHTLLYNLALVMVTAGCVSVLFHRIGLPVALGYILAGVLIGPGTPQIPLAVEQDAIEGLSELGIVFLLFCVGLEFNLRRLARVGIGAGLTAALEIGLMLWLGYHVARFFGWSAMDGVFLGAMLSINSSMFLVKILADRGEERAAHAQFSTGVAIFEDILGAVMLGVLSGIAVSQAVTFGGAALALGKLTALLAAGLLAGLFVVPPLVRRFSRRRSSELLLTATLGICCAGALLAEQAGLSTALGAFVAGTLVAEARENHRIMPLMSPVRDMFSAIFFVSVGMLIRPEELLAHWGAALVIALVTLVGRAAAIFAGTMLSGHSPRTAVRVGINMAQIGEFSFIIATLGLQLKVIDAFLYPVAVAVSALTMLASSLLMRGAEGISDRVQRAAPQPLLAAVMAYSQWLGSLGVASPVPDAVRLVLRRSLLQIFINLLVGAGIFIGAAGLAGRFHGRAGWWTALPPWTGGINTVFWFGALLVVLPFWVAVVRKLRAVGMILAEMAVPSGVAQGQVPSSRSIVSSVVLASGTVISIFWLLMLSALILPPWPMLAFLAAVAAGITFLLRDSFIRIYARGQLMLREMFAEPLEEFHRQEMPTLLRRARLETVEVPAGARAAGMLLGETNLRAHTGANVIGVDRSGASIVSPGADLRLEAGDRVLLMGNEAQLAAARDLLRAAADGEA
ncbi:MAG: cation/H(+) antiporter [Candidatus Hydrogenedentes bacterium]|nr:cation/H(+) antiporter [Candidatus Hydrogenedentota bacterium]